MNDIYNNVQILLEKHLEQIKVGIKIMMSEHKRNASGRSVSSLAVMFESPTRASLEGDEQWMVMEDGRGSGKGPYGFRDIIKQWIINKGISIQPRGNETQDSAINSAAYLITRSIIQKGSALHRLHEHQDIYDSVVDDSMNKLAKDVGVAFETKADIINSNFVKYGRTNNK